MFSLAENPEYGYHSLCAFYRRHPRYLLLLFLTVLLCLVMSLESCASEHFSPVILQGDPAAETEAV